MFSGTRLAGGFFLPAILALFFVVGCSGSGSEPKSEASGETRTVEHGLGTSEVPVEPERIVAFGSAVDAALFVGVEPVGVNEEVKNSKYLAEELEGVESFGSSGEPDLERIAALDPDLIVGLDVVVEGVYEQLSEIAPTVGVPFGDASGNWKEYNRGYAEALNRAEEFEEASSEYEAKAEEIREEIDDAPEVAVMRASAENLRFDLPGIFIGAVFYEDAGLSLPPELAEAAENPENFTLEVSREELGVAEGAEHVFLWNVSYTQSPEEDREEISAFIEDPLFGRLEAAEEGNVYPMGDYSFAESYIGADMILDDINKNIVEGS